MELQWLVGDSSDQPLPTAPLHPIPSSYSAPHSASLMFEGVSHSTPDHGHEWTSLYTTSPEKLAYGRYLHSLQATTADHALFMKVQDQGTELKQLQRQLDNSVALENEEAWLRLLADKRCLDGG